MGCGCAKKPHAAGPKGGGSADAGAYVVCSTGRRFAEHVVTNAAVCTACTLRVAGRPQRCGVSGRPCSVEARGGTCPKGRHVGEDGRVPSPVGGTRGLSWWARVKLDVTGAYPGAVERLPGCGCVDWLKRMSERLSAWSRRGAFSWGSLDQAPVRVASSPVAVPTMRTQPRSKPWVAERKAAG